MFKEYVLEISILPPKKGKVSDVGRIYFVLMDLKEHSLVQCS